MAAIGIFDSGYGGLTVYKEIVKILPEYDYIYLGDNARSPYGTRSYETVYRYTLSSVTQLFEMGCQLVILACNTASAKALRTIQQKDLLRLGNQHKVLGVIRPTTESVGHLTRSGHIGILATPGTISSLSYPIEIQRFFPKVKVFQEACPMWVPLVENNEHESEGADYFVKKYIHQLLNQSGKIDTIILACTHYPLLINKIRQFIPQNISVFAQGDIVAKSLKDYLQRHPEIEVLFTKSQSRKFYTTDDPIAFDKQAGIFLKEIVQSEFIKL